MNPIKLEKMELNTVQNKKLQSIFLTDTNV